MTIYNIKIVSDTVCPFCYIGRSRLDRAITIHRKTVNHGSRDTFNIQWHAFLLNRDPAASSVPMRDMVARRFGESRLESKHSRMAQLGASEGFCLNLDGRIGDSRDSHRVIQLGRTKGPEVEDQVAREVMHMFFEGKGDITSWDDLVGAAEKAGIEAGETRKWLEDGKGNDEVDREVAEADAMGMKGVPAFIINDKYRVDGAEDVYAFMEQFMKVKEDEGEEDFSDEE